MLTAARRREKENDSGSSCCKPVLYFYRAAEAGGCATAHSGVDAVGDGRVDGVAELLEVLDRLLRALGDLGTREAELVVDPAGGGGKVSLGTRA